MDRLATLDNANRNNLADWLNKNLTVRHRSVIQYAKSDTSATRVVAFGRRVLISRLYLVKPRIDDGACRSGALCRE